MTERPPLRAVKPGDKPEAEAPKSISEALDGTSRDVLAAMRKALARKLDDGEIASNSIAAAYKELRELDRLIRADDAEAAAEEAQRNAASNRQRRSFDSAAL